MEESRHKVPGVVAMEMEKNGGTAADGLSGRDEWI